MTAKVNKPKDASVALDENSRNFIAIHQHLLGQNLPNWCLILIGLGAAWGTLTPNKALTICSFLIVPILFRLLWRSGQPPILFLINFTQWIQASGHTFYANYLGQPISVVFGSESYFTAAALNLVAVLVIALGMSCFLSKRSISVIGRAEQQATQLILSRLFFAYGIAYFATGSLWLLWRLIPRLAQVLTALASLKWIFIFMIAYSTYVAKKPRKWVLFATAIEFLSGFLGFFSSFKTVFFVLFCAYFAPRNSLQARRVLGPMLAACFLFFIGVIWTTIKMDYRGFLNQGTGEQVVAVPVSDRLTYLNQAISNFDSEKLESGVEQLMVRLGTTQIFGDVISYVPKVLPYENGKLWKEAITRVLQPRLFFPNKETIEDSDRARLYTGINFAGKDESTSISIGFVAESYIDFGPYFMFIPIFGVGLFFGGIYFILVTRTDKPLLGFALMSCYLAYGYYPLEVANTKLVGGGLTLFGVYFIFDKMFARIVMDSISQTLIIVRKPRNSLR